MDTSTASSQASGVPPRLICLQHDITLTTPFNLENFIRDDYLLERFFAEKLG